MTRKNWTRQMHAVRNLEVAPTYGNYVVTKFSTEEWAGGVVAVVRHYKRADAVHLEYHQMFKVGT
jgi:hypothetical protein